MGRKMIDKSMKYLAQLRQIMADNSSAGKLSMWTVYDHPTDFPEAIVARLFVIDAGGSRPTESFIVADDLETLRYILCFDLSLTCLTRDPSDDGKIVETWL